jgi:hypothetical protein
MSTYLRKTLRTLSREPIPPAEFDREIVVERMTVGVVWADNAKQRRTWRRAASFLRAPNGDPYLRIGDWGSLNTIWESVLEQLYIARCTLVQERGLVRYFSIIGPRESLEAVRNLPVLLDYSRRSNSWKDAPVPYMGQGQ